MRCACAELALLLTLTAGCTKESPPAPVVPLQLPAPVEAPPPRAEVVSPALPPSGYRLAWISEASGTPQVVVDGAPLTSGDAHFLSAATATGELLVTRARGEREQLVAVSLDGGARTVGAEGARARNATSVSGRVLFEGEGSGMSSLRDERGALVLDDTAGAFEPSFAPDGTWFAFVSSVDGNSEIYRAAPDGGARRRLTAFHLDDVAPRVSPDGKWVLFTSNREGSDRLFLVAPDGRGTRRLHPEEISRDTDGGVEAAEADAVWTPDSRAVVFSARGHGGSWHLFRVEVAKGTLQQLSDGPYDDQLPAISPDGKWIAFVSSRAGDAELFALAPDGGISRITTSPGSDWKPLWVPR
jgi:hypothetical protein